MGDRGQALTHPRAGPQGAAASSACHGLKAGERTPFLAPVRSGEEERCQMPTHPARCPQRRRGSPRFAAHPGWSRGSCAGTSDIPTRLQTSTSCLGAVLTWSYPCQLRAQVLELRTAKDSIKGSNFPVLG